MNTTRRNTAATAALALAGLLACPPARADAHHPEVPPREDLLARVDGLPRTDPGPYQDCVGQSCHIVFKTSVDDDERLCDMYSQSQTAKCAQTVGTAFKGALLHDEEFVRAGEDEPAFGGQTEEGPDPIRAADAETLPDHAKITFTGGGEQIECWADRPVVGCRTPQGHGFELHHNGGGGW